MRISEDVVYSSKVVRYYPYEDNFFNVLLIFINKSILSHSITNFKLLRQNNFGNLKIGVEFFRKRQISSFIEEIRLFSLLVIAKKIFPIYAILQFFLYDATIL